MNLRRTRNRAAVRGLAHEATYAGLLSGLVPGRSVGWTNHVSGRGGAAARYLSHGEKTSSLRVGPCSAKWAATNQVDPAGQGGEASSWNLQLLTCVDVMLPLSSSLPLSHFGQRNGECRSAQGL